MKFLLTLITLVFTTLSCSNKQVDNIGKEITKKNTPKKEKVFALTADFPLIKDTVAFITNLREAFELYVHDSPLSKEIEKISFYKKIKLYGSDKDFYFIEYDYGVGSMASCPWKYQLLLTETGKLVKTLSAQRFEFLKIFPEENPFLLNVTATSKGNGGHEVYKISADTLENVYEGYYDYAIQTYDAHQDNAIFEPVELKVFIVDENKDGFNDIAFKGKIILIQGRTKSGTWYDNEIRNGKTISYSIDNPFKIAPIEFVFLYDKVSKHFKAKEDYEKKYKEFHY
jgi:hypothetical protein